MGSPEVIDGRYAVSGPLGSGGMAEVFATDTATGRDVAIKLLRCVEPTSTRRFRSEACVRRASTTPAAGCVDGGPTMTSRTSCSTWPTA